MTGKEKVKEMYPGVLQKDEKEPPAAIEFPVAPLNTLLGFDMETYRVPLDCLQPSKRVAKGVIGTRKFKQIVSSINEIGLIEPLSIIGVDDANDKFLILDGHLRALALKEVGQNEAPCLIASDDETYTCNHRVNRLSTVQEHYMIRRAVDRGVSKERLARAFDVNLSSINRRISLLEGICPKAVTLLNDRHFTPGLSRFLRKMKAARQVEAVELMIAGNSFTETHANALLTATKPEQLVDYQKNKSAKKRAPLEQIVKLEKEMDKVQSQYQEAEENFGTDLLHLVAARGYLKKLMNNQKINTYIHKQEPDVADHFIFVVKSVAGSNAEVSG